MSILIKGMTMPKNCGECLFFENKYYHHGCLAKPESINNMDMWDFEVGSRPPSWCPLIERKHGKWIEYPIADGMNQCSVCGVLRFGDSNYCPNCGADMREADVEDDS